MAQGRIGAVLQDGGLTDNFTVAETLRATASMQSHRGDLGDLVRQTDLAGILRRQVERCSGGERQRLRLALALMTAPALLVLDEPTAGMDVTSRIAFWDTMRSQSHSGRTIVFATHYLEEAASFADRIVIIASGRLVADGSVDQIRAMGEGALVTASWPGLTPQDLDRAWAAAAERVPVLAASLLSRTVRGEHLEIRTTAPDDVARWLLTATPAENLGVSATSLDDVFTALTTTPARA
ncbi:ABC transporter ATP-binding protein [Actinomyces sp. oral taxon 897]|uniref:ATP-binding cassette domain-containing protein n=1 Tax=Actinomyces sp. oral taxon 897 TaxID=2081702 RepID=UPI00157F9C20